MSMTTKTHSNLVVFGVPLLLILSVILITKSQIFATNTSTLSIGITLDLLFTIPIVYFILIKRKIFLKLQSFLFLFWEWLSLLILSRKSINLY